MLNTDALPRSPYSEESIVPTSGDALGGQSLAESPFVILSAAWYFWSESHTYKINIQQLME